MVWLPDSETNFMYQLLNEEDSLDLVPVCREGETMAIAAGLWVGGKKPVVLIQNTGIFESGDSIRGLGLDINQPWLCSSAIAAGPVADRLPIRRPATSSPSSNLGHQLLPHRDR